MKEKIIKKKVKYTAIVLLEEISDNFPEYIRNLHTILSSRGAPYEIVVVANGTEGFLRNEFRKPGSWRRERARG